MAADTTNPKETVEIGGPLDLAQLVAVADGHAAVGISAQGLQAIDRAYASVQRLLHSDAEATYGVNTGFGALAEIRIPDEDLETLQHNLLRSHAVGVGAELGPRTTRAMMLLRAHVLALGYSGVRRELVTLLVEMLNRRVHPVIPERGSVGASGDLAPLAHLALVLIGEGEAEVGGEVLSGAAALAAAGLSPLRLGAKEGLALINGTQGMMAVGGLAVDRADVLVRTADVTGAMSLEGLLGSTRPFDPEVVEARPHPGAIAVAARLRALLADSPINKSHAGCSEVQDAYSLRCMPQVHGSARDALGFAQGVLAVELGSATDNPLVLSDGRLQSGGNFHGQPVAMALDLVTAVLADMASISERRVAQLVDPHLNRGLPAFLAQNSGLNSGFMMAQVTAASLVSEAKALAHPKSVDSIPTSADREDHVSMGMTAARHLREVVDMYSDVLAIEAVVASHAVSLRGPDPSPGIKAACDRLAEVIPPITDDRAWHRDFKAARALVTSGDLLSAADGAATAP